MLVQYNFQWFHLTASDEYKKIFINLFFQAIRRHSSRKWGLILSMARKFLFFHMKEHEKLERWPFAASPLDPEIYQAIPRESPNTILTNKFVAGGNGERTS